jgi:hypothetical protein
MDTVIHKVGWSINLVGLAGWLYSLAGWLVLGLAKEQNTLGWLSPLGLAGWQKEPS